MGELKSNLNQLISITSQKKHRLKSIFNMTKMQNEAIERSDIDLLTGYIQEKQRHIDAIDALDKEFTRTYDDNIKARLANESLQSGSPEELQLYGELQAVISQVQKVIRAIHDMEKTNSFQAQKVMNDLKGKIRHIQTGKKGYDAYNRTATFNDGIYIDQKK